MVDSSLHRHRGASVEQPSKVKGSKRPMAKHDQSRFFDGGADAPIALTRHSAGVGAHGRAGRTLRCNRCGRRDQATMFRSPTSITMQIAGITPKKFWCEPYMFHPRCPTCFSDDVGHPKSQVVQVTEPGTQGYRRGRVGPHGGLVFTPSENAPKVTKGADAIWLKTPDGLLRVTPHRMTKSYLGVCTESSH